MSAPQPIIQRRRGGWFVCHESPEGWSGPWGNERAAELAREGRYEEARAEELAK